MKIFLVAGPVTNCQTPGPRKPISVGAPRPVASNPSPARGRRRPGFASSAASGGGGRGPDRYARAAPSRRSREPRRRPGGRDDAHSHPCGPMARPSFVAAGRTNTVAQSRFEGGFGTHQRGASLRRAVPQDAIRTILRYGGALRAVSSHDDVGYAYRIAQAAALAALVGKRRVLQLVHAALREMIDLDQDAMLWARRGVRSTMPLQDSSLL